jgi:hypothetical protein
VQLDLANAPIVRYGLNYGLPTYGQAEPEPPAPTGFVRTMSHHGTHPDIQPYTILVGTSAAFFVCASFTTGLTIRASVAPVRNFVAFDVPTLSARPTPDPRRQEPAQTSPVVLISARPSDRAPTRKYVSLDLEDFQ